MSQIQKYRLRQVRRKLSLLRNGRDGSTDREDFLFCPTFLWRCPWHSPSWISCPSCRPSGGMQPARRCPKAKAESNVSILQIGQENGWSEGPMQYGNDGLFFSNDWVKWLKRIKLKNWIWVDDADDAESERQQAARVCSHYNGWVFVLFYAISPNVTW